MRWHGIQARTRDRSGDIALYAAKLCVISPYTATSDVYAIVDFLKQKFNETYAAYERLAIKEQEHETICV